MDGLRASLVRLRWRRRGAWMWPAFLALTAADAGIGHALPSSGMSERLGDALLSAVVLNLLVVALLSHLGGALLRRVRRDLPSVVARDYAGTALLLALALALLAAGVAHRGTVMAQRRTLRDAIVRAQAWIGARAPAEFRGNLDRADTVTIDRGIYRTCVPSAVRPRTYCVVVKTALPLQRSVTFAGYESNAVFSAGMG
jgi:hypothetical protein